MKDLSGKIRTKTELRVKLGEWARKQESFTTQQASEAVKPVVSDNFYINNNKLAQMLRGNETHEYHEGLKKWIKKRT